MSARILVVEDNPANLDLMIYLLRAFGYQPRVAQRAEEGLLLARAERPDLVVCDIQLPGADGYDVARWMREDPALCRVPLIAVTALAMVGDRDRVLAAGFDGYVSKPIDPETFVSQIECFLSPEQRAERSGMSNSAIERPAVQGGKDGENPGGR
jgi:CheY-like chemotaxis protein